VGRRLLAIGVAVALQAGALTSPLVHAHLDDHHDDHHDASRVHAHVGGHVGGHAGGHREDAGGTTVHEAEAPERIVALALFVATYADAGIEPAVAPALFRVAPSTESLMRRPPEVVRSHGPPPPASSAPRAPPVFPS
jgi:hypothetical protein